MPQQLFCLFQSDILLIFFAGTVCYVSGTRLQLLAWQTGQCVSSL